MTSDSSDYAKLCHNNVEPMVGGRLKQFLPKWRKITSDPHVLNAVSGYRLEFSKEMGAPSRTKPPYLFRCDKAEEADIDLEISKLHDKGVIEPCQMETGEFVSNIFTRPKKDGGTRVILDLSDLNKYLQYQHFKMENIHTAIELISENSFLASVDLRDAYYTVPVHPTHRKFLKFSWKNQLWQFKVLPNGLSTAPRLFTKLLKPVFTLLREQGHVVIGYLDDVLIIGESENQTLQTVFETTSILAQLGFLVHPEKSVLCPTQEIQFLGFILNTQAMTIRLPDNKSEEIQSLCTELMQIANPSIRQVARIIGKMVASFPAVQYGQLYYRALERDKIKALKMNKGHFDRKMSLSLEAKQELQWWTDNVQSTFSPLRHPKPMLELCTDASGKGWGASDHTTHTGGRWNEDELQKARENKINYLETLAAGMGLKSFCSNSQNIHVLLRLDNSTAVAYINNMGGIKSLDCDRAAREIWQWCETRKIWVTAAHLPGKLNVEADRMSRIFNDRTEWMLDRTVFQEITSRFGTPEIDLFASRLNKQVENYVTWLPDPHAKAVDAFTLDWGKWYFYAFPPFCLVAKCIQKIKSDNATGILVVPKWPSQPWFPLLNRMMNEEPLVIHRSESLLTLPVSNTPHPLNTQIDLLACRFCASPSEMRD